MRDGILIIDKPAGPTSHDIVSRVRKIMKTRRVGHAGTLDPFATGVLVVCINKATRLSQFLTGEDKEYEASMLLGYETDTGDLTGKATTEINDVAHITTEMVRDALNSFKGQYSQTPPMYSAKKIGGVKLYEMARRGEVIERKPVEIDIKEIELIQFSDNIYTFRVVCSSGTYIRVLAEDVGKRLGVGAHLTSLKRIRSGKSLLKNSIPLDELQELSGTETAYTKLAPMIDAVDFFELILNGDELKTVWNGNPIAKRIERDNQELSDTYIKICDESRKLIAIAEYDVANGIARPKVVIREGDEL